ncbi:hypothetical protein Unana1_04379 [Umbelopsis nana]
METAVELSPEAYPCRWFGCSNQYNDPEHLYLHLTNDHVGRKATRNLCLKCHWEDCSVETVKRDHITSHLRVHIPLKPHHCSYCSKTFKRPQDLKKHEKTHTEEEIEEALSLQNNLNHAPHGLQPLTPPRHPQSDKSLTPNTIHQPSPLGYPISPPQSTTYSEDLIDSFSANPSTSPYTDITEQFTSGENALEFSADDFVNLHDSSMVGNQGLAGTNKRGRSSVDASDAINELFADVLQNKKLKSSEGLKPEYSANMVDRLNTLSTFVEGIDSNTIDLNIQDEQDVAFFNEWMAQLSTNIGQGDDTLALQLNQTSLSNAVYQDVSVNQMPNNTGTLGEAASYSSLFANSDMGYSNANTSPFDIDQNILSTSSSVLYPTAGDSQYVHSKPSDDYNVSAGYPSIGSGSQAGNVGTVGQRQHYSNTPSIAPTYFMPNMNVALNYGRSNEAEKMDYSTLAHLRTPRADNSIEVKPEKGDQSLPAKEQVTHERKKNVQTVLAQMAGQKPQSRPSSKFTTFIQYVTPSKPQSEKADSSRGISPSDDYEPHSQPASPQSNGQSTYPYSSSKATHPDSDSHVDILTMNMDNIQLEDHDEGVNENGVSGTTSLYPTSPLEASESNSDIETRRKHLLVLHRLYELVSSKYPKVTYKEENVSVIPQQTIPAL